MKGNLKGAQYPTDKIRRITYQDDVSKEHDAEVCVKEDALTVP